jgi:hypothetical protein
MPTPTKKSVRRAPPWLGVWERQQPWPDCAARYPARLDFQANGHYRGQAEVAGEFTLWDVGVWVAAAGSTLRISTANDAVVAYQVACDGKTLHFTDAQGCRFGYVRTA